MKKSKLLAGVLVASIAMLGTAYAAWTDRLTLTTTVSTGELKVIYDTSTSSEQGEINQVVTNDEDKPTELPEQKYTIQNVYDRNSNSDNSKSKTYKASGPWYYYGETVYGKVTDTSTWREFTKGTYNEDKKGKVNGEEMDVEYEVKKSGWYSTLSSIQVTTSKPGTGVKVEKGGYIKDLEVSVDPESNLKGVTLTMKNLYPGAFASGTFTAVNAGSIPAVIDYIEFNDATNIFDETKIKEKALADILMVEITGTANGVTEPLKKSGTLSELESLLDDLYSGIVLENKDDELTTTIKITFPIDQGQDEEGNNIHYGLDATVGLDIVWKQHNVLPTTRQ